MNIARILYPIEVLGPGKRIGIWVCGCPHHCKGCSNPELWDEGKAREISEEQFSEVIAKTIELYPVDGFTITGGEPFFDYDNLKSILSVLHNWSDDILVYSGYTREEIEKRGEMPDIACLIDGRYIEELNDGSILRGSSNQRIHILNNKYKRRYSDYLNKSRNEIQNFTIGNSVISVGIHNKNYPVQLKNLSSELGLIGKGE